ncbi:MAG: helix-hairpin-helix domain-containing protein [Gammaproteobacteria bacterium]|nr:helix-hairpin-helix domain-containing protein [Gammaproteobacteria bacterium]MBU1730490.1 helix-hairpin-helix domain-containing protein [Patescibacteria group bacterium]MBU1932172.1 helix-hairpin-helix domain-containing protein [Patescibacteria group bacterium]
MNKDKQQTIKDLQALQNIGPATAKRLYSIGIKTLEQMRRSDPEELYKKLKKKGGGILDKCVLYQLRGAILNAPWPKCKNIIKYSKGRIKK